MPISILIWLVQIALVVHVLKTGRNRYWIMMLLFMPLIGGIAYLVIELLPEFSGSIARRYAEALLDAGRSTDAQDIIEHALKGLFKTEPTLLLLKARILFDQNHPRQAVDVLESLQQNNPDFRNPEGHLLYARALEADGQTEAAIREYSAVAGYFPGVEARYRLALCLRKAGKEAAANSELESILTDAKLAPAHFRRSQKYWLDAVKREAA